MIKPHIHEKAIVDPGAAIGAGTRVWAFAHILSGAVIGEDCNICDHTFIEGVVRLGDRVTLKCGVYLWDGLVLEDDVFVGPCAAFTNDLRPRSRQHLERHPIITLRQGCSIGANATILPGLTIGRFAMVGAGAVVTRNVPDFALVAGNPARFRAWICRCGQKIGPLGQGGALCACGHGYELQTDQSLQETSAAASPGPTQSNPVKPNQTIEEANVTGFICRNPLGREQAEPGDH
jgi:acetyltransferase-like isoleucine patch superfamily enzyme